MVNENIALPDEAVEAAARALARADLRGRPAADDYTDARTALGAAATHMLAEAWVEGAQAGFESTSEGFNGECAFDHCAPDNYPPTNPYSGTKWEVQDYTP